MNIPKEAFDDLCDNKKKMLTYERRDIRNWADLQSAMKDYMDTCLDQTMTDIVNIMLWDKSLDDKKNAIRNRILRHIDQINYED